MDKSNNKTYLPWSFDCKKVCQLALSIKDIKQALLYCQKNEETITFQMLTSNTFKGLNFFLRFLICRNGKLLILFTSLIMSVQYRFYLWKLTSVAIAKMKNEKKNQQEATWAAYKPYTSLSRSIIYACN